MFSTYDTQALALHLGNLVEVVGEVTCVDEHGSPKGPYFFIDFGEWKQGCFRLVIWSKALVNFQQAGIDPHSFHRKWLRVAGTLDQYHQPNGTTRLQIEVSSPAAITILADAQAAQDLLKPPPTPTTIVPPSAPAPKKRKGATPASITAPGTSGTPVTTTAQPGTTSQWSSPARAGGGNQGSTKKASSTPKERVCAFCTHKQRATAKVCSQCGIPLDPATRFKPGQLLSRRYTVQRALSRGGMGEIYLALDGKLFDRVVVIKVMLDYFDTQNPQEVQAAKKMFEQEARTLSNLNHPAFPKIYDYFQQGADGCIVMELITGENLEQRLSHQDLGGRRVAGQPYPLLQVVQWGVEICRSLEYLAAVAPSPVVHHDIKPANLLLDQNGMVRLVDFGTARPRAVTQAGSAAGQMTEVYGTPGYAPSEQYRGQTEPRSDIFALGATLYHLLTDDDPRGHPFSFPQLSQLGPLGTLLQRALDNDVSRRPVSGELRRSLETSLAAEEERQRQCREEELRRQRDAAEQERRRLEAVLQRELVEAALKQQEAEQRLQDERNRQLEREQRARQEAKAEAERKAKAEAERKAKAETKRQAEVESAQRLLDLVEQKARAEAERQAKQAQLQAEDQLKRDIADLTRRQEEIQRELQAQQAAAASRLKREEQLRRAPDGTLLLQTRDLVTWCERFWDKGVFWLRDQMAEQARFLWGDNIAVEILAAQRKHVSDGNAALDELLAILDPHEFGAARPALQASGHVIDFGSLSADNAQEGALMVKNASRRYTRLSFQHPPWITMAEPLMSLTPGQEHRLVCSAYGSAVTRDFQPQDTIKVFADGTHLGTIKVRAALPVGLRIKLGLAGILHK